MKGRGSGRRGNRKRSAIVRENAINNESQKNKVKKGVNDSIASDSLEKSQLLLSENPDSDKSPTINDESINITNIDTSNLKTTGLDISPKIPTKVLQFENAQDQNTSSLIEINDGNESDGTDTTPKRSSTYITQISVNFFVPPSENEANKKLLSAASKY